MLNKYLKTADSDWYKQRVIAVILCVLACFAVLFIRLFYLQIIKGSELRRLSENNSIRLQRIVPFRGLIFDRSGKMMVDNRPSFDVSVIRRNARPVDHTIDKLSQYLQVPVETLTEKISKNKRLSSYKPITLKQDISRKIRITGHADALGTDDYNRELSSRRAESIRHAHRRPISF